MNYIIRGQLHLIKLLLNTELLIVEINSERQNTTCNLILKEIDIHTTSMKSTIAKYKITTKCYLKK